ncbi:ABC transporter ATP-binding protein [Marinilactibacillus kalidii]|uniref:ABC transporter ATP-binding protein n=1 Tax=Marinilactibacillus kalidii TaxID=2820274 RepID=UPI001ABDB76C
MKEKVKLAKIIILELYEFQSNIFLMILVNILLLTCIPFLQLVLSSQVISWLINGISIDVYLARLILFIGLIGIGQVAQSFLNVYFEEKINYFRTQSMYKIKKKYLSLDYPLIIGKESQIRYNNANELNYSNGSLFIRIISEIINLGNAILGLILYITVLSQLDSLFLVLISIFIISAALLNFLQVRLDKKLFNEIAVNTQKLKYLSKIYGESKLLKDVRTFRMQEWFEKIENQTRNSYYNTLLPKVKLSLIESSILTIGVLLMSALSYFRSVNMIISGDIPVSSFVIFAGSVTILAQTAMGFITSMGDATRSLNEIKIYDDFMSQKQVFNHNKGQLIPKGRITIELRNISYTYPDNSDPTINNLSLMIQNFEKIALVGGNGSGKSTLIKLITGLLNPDEGIILINGIPRNLFNINDYYSLFSPVFQEKYLLTYTIKETILQGLDYKKEKYERVLKISGMLTVVKNLDLGDETKIVKAVYNNGINLSGGQLQKLKLAQALYKDSPILILDEPTAALDPIAEHEVYKAYFRLSDNKMSIFISHRLASTKFCDRVIFLKNGKISESGTHQSLMNKKSDYYELFEAQSYYYRDVN